MAAKRMSMEELLKPRDLGIVNGKMKELGFPGKIVPEIVRGEAGRMIAMLIEMERRVAARSPYYFAKYVVGKSERRDNKLWGWNRNHVELSKQMWWCWATRSTRPWGTTLYVEWCRGSRKSTLLRACLFLILREDPNVTTMLDGDNSKKAAEKTRVVRDLFEDDYVRLLFGTELGPGSLWKTSTWTLNRSVKTSDASMTASGLDASKTGGHYDVIAGDDLQTDENADSPTVNEDVKKNYRLYETLKSGKICTVTYIVGTRWGFNDLGADLQKQMDDEIRRGLPRSVFINRKAAHPYDKNGRPDLRYANFPEAGLDVSSLKRIKIKMKPALYSYNFLLLPLSEEQATFQSKWVRHHDKVKADLVKMNAKFYLAMDTAGKFSNPGKTKKADSTAMIVIAVTTEGDIFVVEARRLQGATKLEILTNFIEICQNYEIDGAVGEEYFEGKKIVAWVRDELVKAGINIRWIKFRVDHKSKEKRIEDLQPYMQNGRIWWMQAHVELEDQMMQHPRAEHDDLPDALALAVKVAIVPKKFDNGPWFKEDDYQDTEEYRALVSKGKAPDYLSVAVARAEYDHANRIKRVRGRFSIPGGRRL